MLDAITLSYENFTLAHPHFFHLMKRFHGHFEHAREAFILYNLSFIIFFGIRVFGFRTRNRGVVLIIDSHLYFITYHL